MKIFNETKLKSYEGSGRKQNFTPISKKKKE